MKRVFILAAVLLAYGSGAFAACPGSQLTGGSLNAALVGKTINANSPSSENWHEIHCGTSATPGNLQKVGVSPTDTVDPQQSVGTWTINGDNSVTYNYGTGGSYNWFVYSTDSGVSNLCWQDSSAVIIATQALAPTQVTCVP